MKKLSFTHQKEFSTPGGKIVRMKALISIHGRQFVECYDCRTLIQACDLDEVIN